MCSDILLTMTSNSLIICINYVDEGRFGFSNNICKTASKTFGSKKFLRNNI